MRDVEKATGLIEAAKLAAMMPEYPDEVPAPNPSVVRPVRHRGQTAVALKPVSEAVQAPLNPVLDRLSHLRLVG